MAESENDGYEEDEEADRSRESLLEKMCSFIIDDDGLRNSRHRGHTAGERFLLYLGGMMADIRADSITLSDIVRFLDSNGKLLLEKMSRCPVCGSKLPDDGFVPMHDNPSVPGIAGLVTDVEVLELFWVAACKSCDEGNRIHVTRMEIYISLMVPPGQGGGFDVVDPRAVWSSGSLRTTFLTHTGDP